MFEWKVSGMQIGGALKRKAFHVDMIGDCYKISQWFELWNKINWAHFHGNN